MKEDTTYSSIWLFEKSKYHKLSGGQEDTMANQHNYHQARGINYSEFNPTLCHKILSMYGKNTRRILDPFAGRTRALLCQDLGFDYTGFEVSPITYHHISNVLQQPKLETPKYKAIVINDDSFNIESHNLGQFDMIFTCPPYHNLEKYESCEGQLSDIDSYDYFLVRYKEILKKCIKLLKPLGLVVLVVGDFRVDKKLHLFHLDTCRILSEIGLVPFDFVINQSVTFDIAAKRFGGFKDLGYVAKVHEFVLVYKKP
jgi:DNA modification methylase